MSDEKYGSEKNLYSNDRWSGAKKQVSRSLGRMGAGGGSVDSGHEYGHHALALLDKWIASQ